MRSLLAAELEGLERAQAGVERAQAGVEQAEQQIDQLRRHADARVDDLLRHADTRVDQAQAEIADLRQEQIGSRGERAQMGGDLGALAAALSGLQGELEGVRDARLPELSGVISNLQDELREVRDARLARIEADAAALQRGLEGVQGDLEQVRDGALPALRAELQVVHADVVAVQRLGEELRDARLPALAARFDALVERLHEELTVTSSLVDRALAGERTALRLDPVVEAELPAAMRAASVAFADTFRGERRDILERAREYVPLLEGAAPVLDLGCGRGELLEALRDAGIQSRGVDADPAMVEACRRRALAVDEGDALASLCAQPSGSLGAVTAVHVVEHLAASSWLELIEQAARVLRPGGVLLIESPNPEALRVGANLFWIDPTHRVPVHPDAIAFAARASGLEVIETRRLRPFPAEQRLASADQPDAVRALAERLDAWLSGPRDYLLIARRRA